MGAQRGPPLIIVHILLVVALVVAVSADSTVTVPDTDPSIIYDPPASWSESSHNDLDAGGSHASTEDVDATATFFFTGTAIYFWAPLWPSRVTTAISLDNADPVVVPLRDTSLPLDPESGQTVKSSPVWFMTGLENTQHVLVISVADGDGLAIVDQLQYTVQDDVTNPIPDPTPDPTPTTSSDPLDSETSPVLNPVTSSSSTLLPAPTNTKAASSASSSTPGLSIAIGIVVALFVCIGLAIFVWWWRRRVRRRRERADLGGAPEMDEAGNATPTLGPALGRTRSARYRDIAAYFGTSAAVSGSSSGGGSRKGSGYGRRRAPPPPVAKRRSRPLGTIPEIHPREAPVEEEETDFSRPGWAEMEGGGSGIRSSTGAEDSRQDPWTIRAS